MRYVRWITIILIAGIAVKPVLAETITEIELSRTGCYGTCPVYSVTVKSDGKLTFVGKHHVARQGTVNDMISKSDVQLLVVALNRSGFFDMKDRYETKADGCREVWTDNASVQISAKRGSAQKQVMYYYGCRGFGEQAAIKWLAQTIDFVAGTARWVEKP